MRKWKGIVIHHSASPDVPATEIDRWHKERGWDGIGYHFVVRKNGGIEPGRGLDIMGAHAKDRNRTHIGIFVTGDYSKDSIMAALDQVWSVNYLVRGLKQRFDIPKDKIEPHHRHCPGENFPFYLLIRDP